MTSRACGVCVDVLERVCGRVECSTGTDRHRGDGASRVQVAHIHGCGGTCRTLHGVSLYTTQAY